MRKCLDVLGFVGRVQPLYEFLFSRVLSGR